MPLPRCHSIARKLSGALQRETQAEVVLVKCISRDHEALPALLQCLLLLLCPLLHTVPFLLRPPSISPSALAEVALLKWCCDIPCRISAEAVLLKGWLCMNLGSPALLFQQCCFLQAVDGDVGRAQLSPGNGQRASTSLICPLSLMGDTPALDLVCIF